VRFTPILNPLEFQKYVDFNISSTNESPRNKNPTLLRIDNGWDRRLFTNRYDPLFPPLAPKPWFKDLNAIINSYGVKTLLENERIVHEETLFDRLEPFLEGGLRGWWGWMRVGVTRGRMHLFLRWCDQRGMFVE
jgi:hypothetical protein